MGSAFVQRIPEVKQIFILTLILLLGFCSACQAEETTSQSEIRSGTETLLLPTPTKVLPTTIPEHTPTIPQKDNGIDQIVFYSNRDGNPDIYTYNPHTQKLKRLTDDPAFDDSPALSQDGRQIVFLTARHDPDPKFPNLKYEIYMIDSDGENLRRLTSTEVAEDHPAWSPDGSKIIFDADYDGDGFYEIYTIAPDGTGLTRLTYGTSNDQFADWSPDGSRIAFASDRNGNWDIFVMDIDGSNPQALTTSQDWELFPAWSPDGAQIAFTGLVPRSRNTDVYVMNATGSNIRQLTASPGFDENPAWSPDGKQVAFHTERDGNFKIYVMDADGGQQDPLRVSASDELWATWGPAAP